MISTLLKYLLLDRCIDIVFRSWDKVMATIDPRKIKVIIGKLYDIDTEQSDSSNLLPWYVAYRQYISAQVVGVSQDSIVIICNHIVQDMRFPSGSGRNYEDIIRDMGRIIGVKTQVLQCDINAGVMSVLISYYKNITVSVQLGDIIRCVEV